MVSNKVILGINDLQTWCINNNKEGILGEWDSIKNRPLSPENISYASSKKVHWKCSLGHEWDCTVGSRTTGRQSGCPYCSNPPKRILVGFNDFETWCIKNGKEYLLKEWNSERNTDFTPSELSFGSGKQVWWKCDRGHEWRVSLSNRIQGTKCPVCSRTQTSFPEQAIAYYLSKTFMVGC